MDGIDEHDRFLKFSEEAGDFLPDFDGAPKFSNFKEPVYPLDLEERDSSASKSAKMNYFSDYHNRPLPPSAEPAKTPPLTLKTTSDVVGHLKHDSDQDGRNNRHRNDFRDDHATFDFERKINKNSDSKPSPFEVLNSLKLEKPESLPDAHQVPENTLHSSSHLSNDRGQLTSGLSEPSSIHHKLNTGNRKYPSPHSDTISGLQISTSGPPDFPYREHSNFDISNHRKYLSRHSDTISGLQISTSGPPVFLYREDSNINTSDRRKLFSRLREPTSGDKAPTSGPPLDFRLDRKPSLIDPDVSPLRLRDPESFLGEAANFADPRNEREVVGVTSSGRLMTSSGRSMTSIGRSTVKSRFHDELLEIKRRVIKFPDAPEMEPVENSTRVPEDFLPYDYFGFLFRVIQPNDFPVDIVEELLWNQVSLIGLFFKSLWYEFGFIYCSALAGMLALAVPCVVFVHLCYRMSDEKPPSSQHPPPPPDMLPTRAHRCQRATLALTLQILLAVFLVGLVGQFAATEHMTSTFQRTPQTIESAARDLTAFIQSAKNQLQFLVLGSLDKALDAISTDFENIEPLLGKPVQMELAQETGVDVALITLIDAAKETRNVARKVDVLLSNCKTTKSLITTTQEKLEELQRQIERFRQQCSSAEKPLCDTIETFDLEVVLRVDKTLGDSKLQYIRRLEDETLNSLVKNLSDLFHDIPKKVGQDTKDLRTEIWTKLIRRQKRIENSLKSFDTFLEDLSSKIDQLSVTSVEFVREANDYELLWYIIASGAFLLMSMVWFLLLFGLICGCCGADQKARAIFLLTVFIMTFLSISLWLLVLVSLVVGGHGEALVCRPLYEEPTFSALSQVIDDPGIIFQPPEETTPMKRGFFSHLLREKNRVDIPIKDMLRDCSVNRASYPTFKLESLFDIKEETDVAKWDSLETELSNLRLNLSHLHLFTPTSHSQLSDLLLGLSINLTDHRHQLKGPVTGRDMSSFVSQMESVANQIRNLETATHLETLAARTKRLIGSHIKPLEEQKEALIYQITALELQLTPLHRQVNQSLSHLKTIQFFINSQASSIAQKKSANYVDRIKFYLLQYRENVMEKAFNSAAGCYPVWYIFKAMRSLFCQHMVDTVNLFWISLAWCLGIILAATPICLKLAERYAQNEEDIVRPIQPPPYCSNHGSPTGTIRISDRDGQWASIEESGGNW
nr:PREDICTED: prominin-1 [Bemisia tabaci]